MPNSHYQNLLDDRKSMEERFEPWPQKYLIFTKHWLTSRRLIEWKKEVERLEKDKCKVPKKPSDNRDESEGYSEDFINASLSYVGRFIYNKAFDDEIKLLQEAIALTEAEK